MSFKIRTRLLFGYLLGIIIMVFVGAIAVYDRLILSSSVNNIERVFEEIDALHDMVTSTQNLLMPANDYIISGDKKEKERFIESDRKVQRTIKEIENVKVFDKNRQPLVAGSLLIYQDINKNYNLLKEKAEEIFSIPNPIGNPEAARLMYEMDKLGEDIIDFLTDIDRRKLNDVIGTTRYSVEKVDITMIIGTVLVLTFALFYIFYLNRTITKPIMSLAEGVHQVEAGRWTRVNVGDGAEISFLANEFNSMIDRLEDAYARVGEANLELTKRIKEIQRLQNIAEEYHNKQMEQAEKLAAVGELATCVAHEIKNPLAGISFAIESLRDDYNGEDTDTRREVFEDILEQIHRLDKTVRDLLDFAKPDQIPHDLSELVDINMVLIKTVDFINPKAMSGNVEVSRELEDNLPKIFVDEKKIQEVFINLALNAIQAMNENGKLHISTHFNTETNPPLVEIRFKDTGNGILPENMSKIFLPFFTTHHTGTGLGLYISKMIVESHGGKIEAASEYGKGSVFTIRLPVKGMGGKGAPI
ncbi:MAG: HAMP domain-containing protein [Deltaproteobacteria bacterium]|nr:HAMP domain-containing protein [Deltaproteobacteria bacterium]